MRYRVILDELFRKVLTDGKTITGPEYLTIARAASDNDIKNIQLKDYMTEKGYTIDSKMPPSEPNQSTMRLF